MSYFIEMYDKLKYPKGDKDKNGLRNAQLGAIHAISSHFTLNNKKAAIVVMPTGSGKTAVLMMTPYVIGVKKALVITPSAMVRGQISNDFKELKTLCKATVFNKNIKKPQIVELKHLYNKENRLELESADVIISTPNCAVSLLEDESIVDMIDLVLIDEAHHTPAKTWQKILTKTLPAKQVLFTATPFRLDNKEIKGEMIYTYSLAMAYRDGIFGEVQFIPLEETYNKDVLIAKKAEEIFFLDRQQNFQHYLMVRTNSRENAKVLQELYDKETKLKLKRIDSSMSSKKVDNYIEDLKAGNLDGIICVDMLGEGFDFPNLKIAAIHSPHKSLASTLQFIGRFARTNTNNIGTAKFIAINNEELSIENYKMYSKDAIWQDIIIDMSDNKIGQEENQKEYFNEFKKSVDINSACEEISLRAIRPNCHAKIYKVRGFNIKSDFSNVFKNIETIQINEQDNSIIIVAKELIKPKWLIDDSINDVQNMLFIVHYQKKHQLLFIYSQIKSENLYELIASTCCDNFDKIPKKQMNNVLAKLQNFEIFNSGLQNKYNGYGESYRILAGSDVSGHINPSTGRLYSAGHVFCKANSEDSTITIGYSSGSKMWSSAYYSIPEYIKWCDYNGDKISDNSIKVKTNTNYDNLPIPKRLEKYPKKIFMWDYSYTTYSMPPIICDDEKNILLDIDMSIIKRENNKITLMVNYGEIHEEIYCDVDGRYTSNNGTIKVFNGRKECSIEEYFNDNPLIFRTTDDITVQGIEYNEANSIIDSFSISNIIPIRWGEYNTDIHVEVGDCKGGKISIQDTLEKILIEDKRNSFIIYDHSSGEIADFIAVNEIDSEIDICLYHVKKMSSKVYNNSVNDLYEVTGQAVKSTIWLRTASTLLGKIESRRKSGHCKFVRGDYEAFKDKIRKREKPIRSIIYIVQPSISKSNSIPEKIQEVLAATQYYINNSGKVKELKVLGSE